MSTPDETAPAVLTEGEVNLISSADEDAELIAYLRGRCILLNKEIRIRDAEIAKLKTEPKFSKLKEVE